MFLFTHIEKCAGTSFNEILSLTYPRYIHITKNKYGGNETRNNLTKEQYNKFMNYYPSGLGGHSVRPHLEFLPKCKRITFLREPCERYISQFNHMRESGWATSIDDFLKNDFYSDFITKKIAGTNDFNYAVLLLNDFVFIGNVAEYSQSLNCLQDRMGIKLIGTIEHKNRRKEKSDYIAFSDLSGIQKLKVEENNKNDIKIFEKFIVANTELRTYSEEIILEKPSMLRVKLLRKFNKYKKEKIVNPIRLS